MKSNGRKVISEKETSETETMEKQDVAIQKEWRWFLIRLLILIVSPFWCYVWNHHSQK